MQGRRITVALPAYNEGANLESLLGNLEETLQSLQRLGYRTSYVVVDDGSTDATREVLDRASEKLPLTVVVHETNQGLGPTLRDSLRKAVELMDPEDVVVTMDADNTHPAPLMIRMVQRLEEGSDVVVASRYRYGSRTIGLSRYRRFLSVAASLLYRILIPIPGIRDYTCGYRAYRAGLLMSAFEGFGDSFIDQRGFQCIPDILLRLRHTNAVMSEVPMVLRYDRKRGRSSMKVGATIVSSLKLLLVRRFEVARDGLGSFARTGESEMGSGTRKSSRARGSFSAPSALLVFLAPVLLTSLFFVVAPGQLKARATDFYSFFEPLGESLAKGEGYRGADGEVFLVITPGYPVIVAGMIRVSELTGLARDSVYRTFVLVAFGTASLLLFLIASTLWEPALAASASLLWVAYPLTLWMMKLAGSEVPFTVLTLAAVGLLWRQSVSESGSTFPLFVVGLLLGLAMLMRPFGIGFGGLACLFVLARFRSRGLPARLALCCLVLAGNFVVVLPWEIYAHRNTGRWIALSSISASTVKLGLTFAAPSRHGSVKRDLDLGEDVLALMDDIYRDESLTSTRLLMLRLFDELGNRPSAVLKLLLIKAGRSLYATDSGNSERWIVAIQAFFLVLLLGSAVLAWRARPEARWLVFLVGLFVFYSWGMGTLIALPIVRYMVPSLSLAFVFTPELVRVVASRMPRRSLKST